MRKLIIINLFLVVAVILSLSITTPAYAVNASISSVVVTRELYGVKDSVTVWDGNWRDRKVYFDYGSFPIVTIYTTGGYGTIYFTLLNDEGYSGTWNGTATSHSFTPREPVEANYRAWVDLNWLGGSPSNDFYLRAVYSDVVASEPSHNASEPLCVGQTVNWQTTVTNISNTPTKETTYVGYYLGTSSNDFSYLWEDDSAGKLDGAAAPGDGNQSSENQDYIFRSEDVGARYLNVKSDYENVEIESNEGNNTNSYGPFTVIPKPAPDFSGEPRTGEPGTTVSFTNLTPGDVTSYFWSFGDGGTSTDPNPEYQYNTVGSFNVSFTVTNKCGSVTKEKTGYIIISYPDVVADFIANKTEGMRPLTVNFTDLSTGNPTSWYWDFGDEGTSTFREPEHIYLNAGVYTVRLTATGLGGSDTKTETDLITVTEPPPTPDFSPSVNEGFAPLDVTFTNLSTGDITSYTWDFGDGVGTSEDKDPTYTYNNAGNYTVELTVSGPGGSDTKVDYITVLEPPPIADFYPSANFGIAPFDVTFTNLSTGNITSYAWDFGDGVGTSDQKDPTYTYNDPGTYDVELTATGPGGSDTKVDSITVVPDVVPEISNVMVTNVRDTSFTVSWLTDFYAPGELQFGTTTSLESTGTDYRGPSFVGETHYVTLSGINPSTTYYFDIVSGSATDNNGGFHYEVTTGPILALPSSDTAYGRVFKADGVTYAEGAIIYLELADKDGEGSIGTSAKMSALVDEFGYWFFNLGNTRLSDFSEYFMYSSSTDLLSLFAQGASEGIAQANVDTGNDSPAVDLILGQTIEPPGQFSKQDPPDTAKDVAMDPTLSWETSSNADSYEYCYDTSDDNACTSWISNKSSTSTSLSGLIPGNTYYWHVRAINPGGTTYSNGSSIVFWSFTIDINAEIDLVKTVASVNDGGNGRIDAGDTINFAFSIENTGNVTLDTVELDDPLVDLNSDACDDTDSILAPNESTSCSASYSLTQADIDAGSVSNTAAAYGNPPDGNSANRGDDASDSDGTTTSIPPIPEVDLVKTVASVNDGGNGRIDAGDTINYAFAVENTGNVTLDTVELDDPLVGFSGVACDDADSILAPGESTTCSASYSLTQSDIDASSVSNTAAAYGNPPDGNPADRGDDASDSDGTTTSIPPIPEVDLVKTVASVDDGGDGRIDAGDTINYAFVVENSGNVTLNTVELDDPLVGFSGDACNNADGILAPEESTSCYASYSLTQADIDVGFVFNTANVFGNPPEGDPEDRGDDASTSDSTNTPIIDDDYPLLEEFDSDEGFAFTNRDRVYIADGVVHWNISRSAGQQFVYRNIPAFSGDVKLTVHGQIDSWNNNCTVRAGIGDGFNEIGDQSGISINYGYFGGGCGPQNPTTPPGPVIMGTGAHFDYYENPACNYYGNWLRIEPGTPYTAEFTVLEEMASLSVPEVGTATGQLAYNGGYDTLYVGFNGTGDWPSCSGTIDWIMVEPIEVVDLGVTKTIDPETLSPGEPFTYLISVTNNGTSTATNVTITDTLPDGLDFVSLLPGEPDCSISENKITCALGDLPAGESVEAAITVSVQPTTHGELTNTVCVTSDEPDSDESDNCEIAPITISSISGQVTDQDGNPIPDVNISIGSLYNLITDFNGEYSIAGLLPGDYTVTPEKAGFAFTQPSETVTLPPDSTELDFSGSSEGSVMLKVSPLVTNTYIDHQFKVDILVQAGDQTVDGAAAYLGFDPSLLQVVSITSGTSLPLPIQNRFDNVAGTIDYAAGTFADFPSGTFTLATVTFEAIEKSDGTRVNFNLTRPRMSDVTFGGRSVLDGTQDGAVIISDRATLIGMVALQGRPEVPDPSWSVPLTVNLILEGETTPLYTYTPTTDEYGEFAIEDILPGTYVVLVKNSHTLQNMQVVTFDPGIKTVDFGTLLEGDANDDNFITLVDFSILVTTFGLAEGVPGFDGRADFNEDGYVTLLDFSLLASNFGRSGDTIAETPQTLIQPLLRSGDVIISVEPVLNQVMDGDKFTVTVQLQTGGQLVDGAQVSLNFDPSVLQVVQMSGNATPFPLELQNQYDNTTGTLDYSAGTLSNFPSGDINVLEIEFEAISVTGTTGLEFNLTPPRTTDVTYGGQSLLTDTTNGVVVVGSEFKIMFPTIFKEFIVK